VKVSFSVASWAEVEERGEPAEPGKVRDLDSFFGSFQHSIDGKSRLALPKPFREIVGVKEEGRAPFVMLAKGFNACLFAFPEDEWPRFEKTLREQPLNDPAALSFVREMAATIHKAPVDRVGRVVIPPTHLAQGGFDKGDEVLVLGMLRHFEIWNPARYEEYIRSSQGTYEERAQKLFFG
jgi:MraZ protein